VQVAGYALQKCIANGVVVTDENILCSKQNLLLRVSSSRLCVKKYEPYLCYIGEFIPVTKENIRNRAKVVKIAPAWKHLVSMGCIEHKGTL